MSVRVDTSSLISGAVVCGNRGLGYTGQYIRLNTASGSNGPGVIYPSLNGTSDDAKEFMFRITTPPSAGVLFVGEPGEFTFSGAPDGSYTLIGDLYEDGVNLGAITFNFNVGRVPLSANVSLSYFIRSLLNKSNAFNYYIRNILSKSNTFNYTILTAGQLLKQLDLNYSIRNNLNKSVTFMYMIDGAPVITKSLTLMYNILQEIPSDAVIIILTENEPFTVIVK